MEEVTLSWKNKDLLLRASGASLYEWIDPSKKKLRPARTLSLLSSSLPTRHSNVLAIGDGMDALEALAAETAVLADKIRLV